jgi:penicillin-binding protein A
MCLVLMGSATWVQFFQAKSLNNDPRNVRTLYRALGDARGPIVVGGTAVAASAPVDDAYGYLREYTDPVTYSSITGYFGIMGTSGLEKYTDADLSGTSDQMMLSRLRDILTGRQPEGAAVETTINPAAQQAAVDALGNQVGAVVAIEPSTGRILALVSTPGFDPNQLASHDTAAASSAYAALQAADGNPLLNKAYRENYAPGSTFKLVVAAAALESGDYDQDSQIASPQVLDLPQTTATIGNFGGETCGSDPTTMANALRISCNTAFAQLGMNLGWEAIDKQAEKFGFNGGGLTIPMTVANSTFPQDLNDPQTAQSSIGQYSVRATPLQIAMVSAAIANGGTLMTPYLVDKVRSANLTTVVTASPEVFSHAISSSTADQLTSMMVSVVDSGTGKPAQISGVAVAGKTGTAEDPGFPPHAWFTGFAPAEDPQVAVAVFVQHGGNLNDEATGGQVAAPIARAVIEAVLTP